MIINSACALGRNNVSLDRLWQRRYKEFRRTVTAIHAISRMVFTNMGIRKV